MVMYCEVARLQPSDKYRRVGMFTSIIGRVILRKSPSRHGLKKRRRTVLPAAIHQSCYAFREAPLFQLREKMMDLIPELRRVDFKIGRAHV